MRDHQGKISPHFGPSRDQQHQADDTFLQHHDQQVDATLAQPGGCLWGFTWGRGGFRLGFYFTENL